MAISRSQLVKELEPGLNALFGLEYKRYENQHAEIYTNENSDRAFEEEVMLSGFANAQVKGEGAGVSFDEAQETFTARYTHETVALAFAITEEAIEDNLYDRLAARYTKALARSMSNAKQVKAVEPLINGLPSTATFKSGDTKALFTTDHPTVAGTFSNTLATQADLNETSLEQSMIDIAAITDERGLRVAARGVKMIIPSELQFTAERLMKSQGRTGTADNDINAIVSMGMVPQGYRVNNYLTDSDAFYILTDVPNGMKMFTRAPLTTAMEGDFDTGNVRYKARERYSFGVSDPRGIFGVEGA
jgi:hypothetical protein